MKNKFKWYQLAWIEFVLTLPFSLIAICLWYYFNSYIPIIVAIVIGFIGGFTKVLEKPIFKIACWWYKFDVNIYQSVGMLVINTNAKKEDIVILCNPKIEKKLKKYNLTIKTDKAMDTKTCYVINKNANNN